MATIDLTLSDDEAQRPPAPAPAAPPPRRRKRDVLDSSSSDGEAPAPAPAAPPRRKKRDVLDSSDDDEAAATARAAANLKRALAKPQDLTLSSDDEQQQPRVCIHEQNDKKNTIKTTQNLGVPLRRNYTSLELATAL